MNTARLLQGLAETLEVPSVTESTVLAEAGSWDSLAIVVTIALFDELGCPPASGEQLAACETVADVLALARAQETQTIGSDEVGDVGDVFANRT
jgi:acyl carrier protein